MGGANSDVVAIAQCEGNLLQMTFTKVCGVDAANFVRSCVGGSPVELWHHWLGHLNVRSVYALQSMVREMNLGKTFPTTSTLVCDACTKGKQYAAKLGNDAERQAIKPLKIMHLDVCGPMKTHPWKGQSILLFLLMFFKYGVGLHDIIQMRVV